MAAHTKAMVYPFANQIDRIESRTKEFISIRDNYLDQYGVPSSLITLDEFLRDATDLIGVRVVAYYNADVDNIRNTLTEIHPQASVEEKLTVHDINRGSRFGYRAVHVNFQFSEERLFRDQPRSSAGVEIQIRTILSDAWARHSHKLVYKSDRPPPDEVLRAFAGTAAMLETADGQIERIRQLPQIPELKKASLELGW